MCRGARYRRARPAGRGAVVGTDHPGDLTPGDQHDPLPEALMLARGAKDAGLGLKLLGGLAVRVVCPDFPPRLRRDQDIDFACMSKGRKDVAAYLERVGCTGDRRFNNLNGDRQMYFTAPSGRPIDVMVDRLTMCHTLDFRPSFGRLPLTIDVIDILLSKLQIVELNEKDVRDLLQILGALPVGGSQPRGRHAAAPAAQSQRLLEIAQSAPKTVKWKLRANIGDRVRWYELPEEVDH